MEEEELGEEEELKGRRLGSAHLNALDVLKTKYGMDEDE